MGEFRAHDLHPCPRRKGIGSGVFRRIGGKADIEVDVPVIAVTDRTPMPGKPQPKPEAQEPTGRLSNDAFWWPAILVAASCIVFSVRLESGDQDVGQRRVV